MTQEAMVAISIGHVNNIPQCNDLWNFQKYSVKILYAIID